MAMEIDLEGFVKWNVSLAPKPAYKCLLPLYEAVSNSIHSVQESLSVNPSKVGTIEITIHRDSNQGVLRSGGKKFDLSSVTGFAIRDNGNGFNNANFASFNKAFSQRKRHLGAKGRGRFMWLKVFASAEVESTFEENGKVKRRAFEFTIKDDWSGRNPPEICPDGTRQRTVVTLVGMLNPYKEHCPKSADAIAGHLVRRFVHFLALPGSSSMILYDPDNDITLNLNDLFRSLKVTVKLTPFQVKGKDFALSHMLLKKQGDLRHELHFCAHQQAVAVEMLDAKLPDLKAPITEGKEAIVYHGYVSSDFLDETVNPERTGFDKMSEGMLQSADDVIWSDIVDQSIAECAKFLEPYTKSIRQDKDRRVNDYVRTEAPWFRHVVAQRPEVLDSISPGASQNEIDLTLYQTSKAIEIELRKQASELLCSSDHAAVPEDYRDRLKEFLEDFGDVGRDQLAKYVAHRKAILSFLLDRLKIRKDGKHHFERDIHQVIFPMVSTSEDIEPDRANLWIIDERLAFHYYLASDKPLRSLAPITIDSGKEPDLIIFDRPFFFGEGEVDIGAAVIIEFKRPMTDDRDPIRQVFGYVRTIRTGTVTKDDMTLKVKDGTPFYAYILCDLTPKMREYAEDAGLKVTPDDEGFIGFNTTHEVYVEVVSYQKAIADAQKRNAILFHKLGLPPTLSKPIRGIDGSSNSDDAESRLSSVTDSK